MLVANPGTSGAVASWVRAGGAQRDGWTLRKPCHPQTSASDPFHAKFILLANRRERITGGQLYFGSGNLSIQGLLKGCLSVESSDHGNVEAGIVVEVETVDEDELFKALGIDLESEVDPLSFPDDASDESSDQASEAIRPTPPILAAVWHYEHRHFVFVRPPNEQRECTVRSGTFSSVVPASTTTMTLPEGVYPETRLEISVAGQSNWSVPVFIEGGGFYRGEAEKFGFDDALVRLQDFPGHGNCDDDETVDGEDEGENPSGDESKKTEKAKRAVRTSFLLHRMMSLVEAVAERNQTVDREQFPDWVAHLRRVLIEEMDPGEIADVKSLGVNVLYPLLAERGFAPPFSDRTYQGIMEQVTERWGLAGFPGFEASDHAGVALP